MAEFYTYRCEKCGHEVETASTGEYSLFSGEYKDYLCPRCHEIVGINVTMPREPEELLACPECGCVHLTPWNPKAGICPKCGGRMIRIEDTVKLVD